MSASSISVAGALSHCIFSHETFYGRIRQVPDLSNDTTINNTN